MLGHGGHVLGSGVTRSVGNAGNVGRIERRRVQGACQVRPGLVDARNPHLGAAHDVCNAVVRLHPVQSSATRLLANRRFVHRAVQEGLQFVRALEFRALVPGAQDRCFDDAGGERLLIQVLLGFLDQRVVVFAKESLQCGLGSLAYSGQHLVGNRGERRRHGDLQSRG